VSTELEPTVDAQIVEPLSENAAKKLDKKIRLLADAADAHIHKIRELLAEAKAGQAHVALGYQSGPAYVADALGGRLIVDVNTRKSIVAVLAGEGMSLRAIAAPTGISKSTVDRELQVSHRGTPDVLAEPDLKPDNVIGLDDKRYPPKRQPKPQPRPKIWKALNVELDGVVRRVENVVARINELRERYPPESIR
jgi:lambda repressor-like predicted transcriptional regulator